MEHSSLTKRPRNYSSTSLKWTSLKKKKVSHLTIPKVWKYPCPVAHFCLQCFFYPLHKFFHSPRRKEHDRKPSALRIFQIVNIHGCQTQISLFTIWIRWDKSFLNHIPFVSIGDQTKAGVTFRSCKIFFSLIEGLSLHTLSGGRDWYRLRLSSGKCTWARTIEYELFHVYMNISYQPSLRTLLREYQPNVLKVRIKSS